MSELNDLLEHTDRYRAITLQFLDLLDDDELDWRPSADAYSCGQQLVHIAATEDFYTHGLFADAWDTDRVRLPKTSPSKPELRALFQRVRAAFRDRLATLVDADLERTVASPFSPAPLTLRWWLWFLVEHEIHHKAQLGIYVRQLGKVAPFYAYPYPPGERPDIPAREQLGGF
ncbi:MAG TPA: DinB family protein [Longimicrobiales bacterium]|nr:DinB family protein [Longimicrobiales bacterium]